jgi:two-component system sensor histidine kinase AlgZ
MHPILAHRSRLALYLALWLLVGALLAGLLAAQGGLTWPAAFAVALPLATAFGFVCLSAWYISRSMPLATTGARRIAATGLTAAVISSGAWLLIARGWLEVFTRAAGLFDVGRAFPALRALIFGFGVLLYLLSLAVSYLLAAFEASQDAERRALQVQVLAREAELRSLRAQIDPHFLFNSLHSISALTATAPAAARAMCVLLAEFLRESLALGAQDRISLARELRLVDRFLGVERMRFGERLQVDITSEGAADCLVPPLVLQPLVENAVTHGIAHLLHGGTIRIVAARAGSTLSITIENPCDADRPKSLGTGTGLANVRARLRALHGLDARVDAAENGGVWRTELSLPVVVETHG